MAGRKTVRPSENGDTVGHADVRETETGKAARKECYRETASSLLWAGGLAAFALYMLWGMFFWLLFLPVALLKIVQHLSAMLFRRPERKLRACKAAVWLVITLISYGITLYRETAVTENALRAADAVERYRAVHNAYPPNLAAAGITEEKGLYHLYYFPSGRRPEPQLGYPSPFTPFDRYFYDFDRREYVFYPD